MAVIARPGRHLAIVSGATVSHCDTEPRERRGMLRLYPRGTGVARSRLSVEAAERAENLSNDR